MDSHPPAGALTRYLRILSKNVELASTPSSQCRTSPFSEPPIIATLFASSTPHFEIRLRCFNQPEGISSKRAAYYDGLFLAVNTLSAVDLNFLRCWPRGRRRRSGSMRPPLHFGKRQIRDDSRAFMPRQTGTSGPAWLRRGVRRRPAVPARTCACPPAAGPRNPAAAPSARPRRRYRPPSPHAP